VRGYGLNVDYFEFCFSFEFLEFLDDVFVGSVDWLGLREVSIYQDGVVLKGEKDNVRIRKTKATGEF
jgi:hypothetical protein